VTTHEEAKCLISRSWQSYFEATEQPLPLQRKEPNSPGWFCSSNHLLYCHQTQSN